MNQTELQALIEDIKTGHKVVLFPPGMLYFIVAIMLSVVAVVSCIGPMVSILANQAPPGEKAAYQMLGLALLFVGSVLPSLMIFRGKKQFLLLFRCALGLIILASTLMLLSLSFGLVEMEIDVRPPLLVSFLLSATAVFLTTCTQYKLLCDFYFYLKS